MLTFESNSITPEAVNLDLTQGSSRSRFNAHFSMAFNDGLFAQGGRNFRNSLADAKDRSPPLSANESVLQLLQSGFPMDESKLEKIRDGEYTQNSLNRKLAEEGKRAESRLIMGQTSGVWDSLKMQLGAAFGGMADGGDLAATFLLPALKVKHVAPFLGFGKLGQFSGLSRRLVSRLPASLKGPGEKILQGTFDSVKATTLTEVVRQGLNEDSPLNNYSVWNSITNIASSALIGGLMSGMNGGASYLFQKYSPKLTPLLPGGKSSADLIKLSQFSGATQRREVMNSLPVVNTLPQMTSTHVVQDLVNAIKKVAADYPTLQSMSVDLGTSLFTGAAQGSLADVFMRATPQNSFVPSQSAEHKLTRFLIEQQNSPAAVGQLITSYTQALQSAVNEAQKKGQVGAALEVDYEQVADRAIEAATHAPPRALDMFEKVAPETRVKVMNVAIIQAQMDKRIDVQAVLDSDPMIGIVMESDLRAAGGKSMVVQRGVLYDGACAQLLEIPLYRELPQVTSRIEQERMDLDDAKVFYVQTSKAQAVAPRSDEVKHTARPEVKPFVQGSYASGVTKTVPLGRSPLGPARNLETILAQAAWRKPVFKLLDSSVLQVVDRVADFPNGPHNAKTKVLHLPDGRLYIAAENVSASELKAIMLREAGTRVGAKAMLGEQVYADVVQQFDDALVAGEAWAMEARANSLEAMESDERYSAMLAYVVEHYPDLPLVQQMVSEMRGWFGEYLDGESEPLSDTEWGYLAASALHGGKREYVGGQE